MGMSRAPPKADTNPTPLASARASTRRRQRLPFPGSGHTAVVNATVLWVIAVILVIVGIVQLFQGQVLFGIVLIIIGCLVGPGGVSIFNRR